MSEFGWMALGLVVGFAWAFAGGREINLCTRCNRQPFSQRLMMVILWPGHRRDRLKAKTTSETERTRT
jgi:hypothetical protein